MPAVSEKQRRAMGAALALKRAGKKGGSKKGPSAKMAKSMDEKQLSDFARKPKKKK